METGNYGDHGDWIPEHPAEYGSLGYGTLKFQALIQGMMSTAYPEDVHQQLTIIDFVR